MDQIQPPVIKIHTLITLSAVRLLPSSSPELADAGLATHSHRPFQSPCLYGSTPLPSQQH